MSNAITTKRSPIVLIRTFVAIELVVVALYLLGTAADAYKYELYTLLPFSGAFTYQTLKLLLLPLAQLIITIYAFLSWYRESYTIRPGVITHTLGVLYKKERMVGLHQEITLTATSGPLGKLLHYGSIRVENGISHNAIILKDISQPQNFLKAVQQATKSNLVASSQATSQNKKTFNEKPNLANLLSREENEGLEFKSSLRFDHKTGQVNRDIEKTAMKTVAAFLNSKGGYLVLGVDNAKNAIGLADDYPHLQRPNPDGFENHFTQVFNTMIGPEFRHLVQVSFHQTGGSDVCIVEALRSTRPVYLKVDGGEHFYIRTGNTTTHLKLSEIEEYNRSRFPRRAPNV